ncbi:thiamine pyrophosphate-requiring protein [Billgrantia tianxiuensis]|uniref:Thiamine pyrophosphate-requiring protein n=1 Tax=Billgrantia tianxiuensis TaxID=2497861 RepID=A0A6I6SNN5_9GAMM|nr:MULTISPECIES: thiamine pyrophosphate-requiring protein [Halomonas]MCE8031681.1 thiamine pyrophosphate-requiring protein [Halomonas sp. MCCC 1A11057]QHC50186.1 thiamine pyrophosphate-requiring protein [Halomonas tianxiuensis]
MQPTVSDFLVSRLREWGVERLYGYSGDGINGFMSALRRAEGNPRLIQPRHEEVAAFMACGHAKFSDQVGVCVATSGPGAVHLLNGLYDARKDHMPAVAIVGQQARKSLGTDYQQELDLMALFKDVASEYVQMVTEPAQARHVIDQAMRIALARRTVTCVILPNDVQDLPMEDPPREHGAVFSGVGYRFPQQLPEPADLDAAAAILNQGEKVAILAGAGVKHAVDELIRVADLTGAGIAKAILAKTMVPDDLPGVTGAIGLLGTEASDRMMKECDTLLMVGTRFPYVEFLPEPGQARAVQIDVVPEALGVRYPTEINLHGDAGATLAALAERLEPKANDKWRKQVQGWIDDWWEKTEARAATEATPINPQRVFQSLSPRLPENVMLTCDVGTATNWYARNLKIRQGMLGSVSGGLASMGNGVPYLIAAKLCHPNRPAIAMVGDGAMQMLGNNALITLAKYWQEWEDPRCIVLVLNNHDLSQVTWEQRVMEGDPKFDISQELPEFRYDQYAELLGFKGLVMREPDDIDRVWNEALTADRPVVINAYTDGDIAPLPPHIEFEQAKSYLASMLKGDSSGLHSAKLSAKQMGRSLFKRKK